MCNRSIHTPRVCPAPCERPKSFSDSSLTRKRHPSEGEVTKAATHTGIFCLSITASKPRKYVSCVVQQVHCHCHTSHPMTLYSVTNDFSVNKSFVCSPKLCPLPPHFPRHPSQLSALSTRLVEKPSIRPITIKVISHQHGQPLLPRRSTTTPPTPLPPSTTTTTIISAQPQR